ncbi:MAG: branched-chain amino acid transaminase, partial [bacterium]|nr:branched-chain amino acid transaminase [bacterium]
HQEEATVAMAQPQRPTPAVDVAPLFWYDGAMVEQSDFEIHPFTHALHYGSGVFEGIRAYEAGRRLSIFRLKDHMERFLRSAEVYRLKVPYSAAELCDAAARTVRENAIGECYIRPLTWFGAGGLSLAPYSHAPTHVMVAVRPLAGYFSGNADRPTVRLTVSPWRKSSSKSLPSTVKCSGHYANSVLAMSDALSRGFDEALMLNEFGRVAEGSGDNVFFVKGGVLYTNDADEDILPGITRGTVLALAARLAIPTTVAPFALEDLLAAEEVFITGTAAEVAGVRAIDDHEFPHGAKAPVTTRLQQAYDEAVHAKGPEAAQWCTLL